MCASAIASCRFRPLRGLAPERLDDFFLNHRDLLRIRRELEQR